MSVPCGAVSGDRSQMQPLLYGRLSFSAENSLPPSQTSSKTFSRYCGSLRLKRGEKGEKKRPSLSPSLSLPPAGSLGGAEGGHDRALPHPGGSRPPLSPPARCKHAAEHGEPRPGGARLFISGFLGTAGRARHRGRSHRARMMRARRPAEEPPPVPFPPLATDTARGATPGVLEEDLYLFFPEERFSLCAFCPSQGKGESECSHKLRGRNSHSRRPSQRCESLL